MPMPFDATLKDLVQSFLPDYERQLQLTDLSPLVPLNVDLSTVSAATDIALGHGDPLDKIVDLNFQSSRAEDLVPRVLMYNALLHQKFRVPVHTVIVLLRPAADDAVLTGKLRYQARPRKGKLEFAYEVIRLWQKPVEQFLRGGLGTLPLAPLARTAGREQALAEIVRRIDDRLTREASPEDRAKLLTASLILSGLRFPPEVWERVFAGVKGMKESTSYQAILAEGREEGREEGRIDEARQILLRYGGKKLGNPSKAIRSLLESIHERERLERLLDRLESATTWEELVQSS
jgi:predicted transposase YdaD